MSLLQIFFAIIALAALSPAAPPESRNDLAKKTPNWTELPVLGNGPRQELSTVALDNEIYIFGGIPLPDAAGAIPTLDSVEVYSLAAKTWRNTTALPIPMNHANAAVVNGKLYILGTLQGGDIWYATPRSWIYTPENEKWTEIAPMPTSQARGSSAIGVLGDEIFLAGGMRSLNPVDGGFHDSINTTTAYNTRTGRWRTLPGLPAPRDHVGGAIVGDTLYVVGGRDHGQVNVRNTTFALDLNNPHAQWKRKADMPTARGGLASGLIGKTIYTFGGEGNPANGSNGVFPQAEAYDTESDTWTKLSSMRVPRHGTGAASIGDAIYVPGGGDHEGDGAVDTFDKFQVR